MYSLVPGEGLADGDADGDAEGEAEGEADGDADGLADGLGEGLGDRLGEGLGEGLTVAPQVTPLMENEAGLLLLPDHVPWNPMLVVAPVPRFPFQDMLVPVTVAPLWLQFADQPFDSLCPFGKLNLSVQLLIASPRFLMSRLAVKPPDPEPQELSAYWTSQETAADAGVCASPTRRPPDTEAAASRASRLRDRGSAPVLRALVRI
ncbi:hypothetical protein GCM10027612_63080 [Microbispora bryophytorum subsp. camponoti]